MVLLSSLSLSLPLSFVAFVAFRFIIIVIEKFIGATIQTLLFVHVSLNRTFGEMPLSIYDLIKLYQCNSSDSKIAEHIRMLNLNTNEHHTQLNGKK